MTFPSISTIEPPNSYIPNSHKYQNRHTLFRLTKMWLFGYVKDIWRIKRLRAKSPRYSNSHPFFVLTKMWLFEGFSVYNEFRLKICRTYKTFNYGYFTNVDLKWNFSEMRDYSLNIVPSETKTKKLWLTTFYRVHFLGQKFIIFLMFYRMKLSQLKFRNNWIYFIMISYFYCLMDLNIYCRGLVIRPDTKSPDKQPFGGKKFKRGFILSQIYKMTFNRVWVFKNLGEVL